MENNVEVVQKAGAGSCKNTFIGEQHNYIGLSPNDAVNMAISMLKEYMPILRQEILDELDKMLHDRLDCISKDNIVPPDPRIAVPALQNASITREEEIRILYANLLANSMNNIVKNGIHPSFIEIIKQLTPDEAKILRYLHMHYPFAPVITLRYEDEKHAGVDVIKHFSNLGELSHCERPFEVSMYFDNLIRLGLIEITMSSSIVDKSHYEPLKNHQYIKHIVSSTKSNEKYNRTVYKEGYLSVTDLGRAFCDVCLSFRIVISNK